MGTIHTRVFRMRDNNGNAVPHAQQLKATCTSQACIEGAIVFTERGNWLMRYDATDASGNTAEQLVFMLTLDDLTKPQFTTTCDAKQTLEAFSDTTTSLCTTETAQDNVATDGTRVVTPTIRYKMAYTYNGDAENLDKDPRAYAYKDVANMCDDTTTGYCTKAQLQARVTKTKVGLFSITAYAWDHAGMYGYGGQNNVQTYNREVIVRDVVKPTITLHKAQKTCGNTVLNSGLPLGATGECCIDAACSSVKTQCGYVYTDERAEAHDVLDDKCSALWAAYNSGQTPTPWRAWACEKQKQYWTASPWVRGVPQKYTDEHGSQRQVFDGQLATHEGHYEIHFDDKDQNDNAASQVVRHVEVIDTEKPAPELCGDAAIIHAANKDSVADFSKYDSAENPDNVCDFNVNGGCSEPGIKCADVCDSPGFASPQNLQVTTEWTFFTNIDGVSRNCNSNKPCPFDNQVVGTWTRTYTCTDRSGNFETVQRTFENDDIDIPIIIPSPDAEPPGHALVLRGLGVGLLHRPGRAVPGLPRPRLALIGQDDEPTPFDPHARVPWPVCRQHAPCDGERPVRQQTARPQAAGHLRHQVRLPRPQGQPGRQQVPYRDGPRHHQAHTRPQRMHKRQGRVQAGGRLRVDRPRRRHGRLHGPPVQRQECRAHCHLHAVCLRPDAPELQPGQRRRGRRGACRRQRPLAPARWHVHSHVPSAGLHAHGHVPGHAWQLVAGAHLGLQPADAVAFDVQRRSHRDPHDRRRGHACAGHLAPQGPLQRPRPCPGSVPHLRLHGDGHQWCG